MGGEQHRDAVLGDVVAEGLPQVAASLDVHGGGGLVGYEQGWVPDQREGESDPLGLASRKPVGLAAEQVADADACEPWPSRQ